MYLKYFILVLLLQFGIPQVLCWVPRKGDPSVKFNTSGGQLKLQMDENNKTPVTLFYIDGAEQAPQLSVVSGNQDKLILSATNSGSSYEISTTSSVDYDAENSKRFIVSITGAGSSPYNQFTLDINNLNDHAPKVIPNDCYVQKNTPYTIDNAACSYSIMDRDSNMQFNKFVIEEANQESKLFAMDYKSIPSHYNKAAVAYLYLKDGQILDGSTPVYHINVTVIDKWSDEDPGQITVLPSSVYVQ